MMRQAAPIEKPRILVIGPETLPSRSEGQHGDRRYRSHQHLEAVPLSSRGPATASVRARRSLLGDNDLMLPTPNTLDMSRRLPNNELVIFPDAGHGGIFQFHDQFVEKALEFLAE
jgi:pimeloyl-ACP methyl ester carboxylesterase